ncbi:MAG: DUF488 family protein [Patescibacteria group bacterium]|nr:DUF488 family protein [Patescibacteria group bacterium]
MKKPNYKRQKALLALLDMFDGKLSKIELQKYMFLYVHEFSKEKHYAFVPYHYGSFSYEMYKDLHTLERNGLLSVGEKQIEAKTKGFFEDISSEEQRSLLKFFMQYKNLRGDGLIGYLYNQYTYYAINSKISDKFISKDKLVKFMPSSSENALYTIGYEGKKFEEYLNQLIQNDVKVLVDVRKNAHSMKYGFSKSTLKNAIENLGLKYIHIPNLGIESENRQTLQTKADYDALFAVYARTFTEKMKDLEYLNEILLENQRIAITCFEKDVGYCHRGVIAQKMKKKYGIVIKHL